MIYSIGEALIDLYGEDEGAQKYAGGASANFSAAVSALGGKSAIITALGDDEDGRFLMNKLKTFGINTDYVSIYPEYKTGRIAISPNGRGSALCLLRREAADMHLRAEDIPEKLFNPSDVLHFCSMSLINSPARPAFIKTLEASVYAESQIVFDVNLRLKQWENLDEFRKAVLAVLPYIDYIKATSNELHILFPDADFNMIFNKALRLKCLIITSGADPITATFKDSSKITIKPFSDNPIDRAGAGDCFFGAFIFYMERLNSLNNDKAERYKSDVKASLIFASVSAESSINNRNDFYAPSLEEVKKRLQITQPK